MASRRTLCLLVALAGTAAGLAQADECKGQSRAVPGTLAAPSNPCPPAAKKRQEPIGKPAKEPDSNWSGIHVGGSVGVTTTIRGR